MTNYYRGGEQDELNEECEAYNYEEPASGYTSVLPDEAPSSWDVGHVEKGQLSDAELRKREIPQYVIEYAPLIHLYSGENFWPGDIADHLQHTKPELDYTPISTKSHRFNLSNLDELNKGGDGQRVFLTSKDNVENRPDWLGGEDNIPKPCTSDDGERCGGRSNAPATLIVVPKDDGVVDAFWFFFYSYNLGNKVFNIRFGNHVGDWEHTLVRFRNGTPEAVFFSEHFFGEAYSYFAVEKIGKRPVGYSATGSHAMYGTPGVHAYILPWGLLHDVTDKGPLWDPALNMYSFRYDMKSDTFRSSNMTPNAPTEWLDFIGRWGDKAYPLSDKRQYELFGQRHYVNGPTGPRFKSLRRKTPCQGGDQCPIKHWRSLDNPPRLWPLDAKIGDEGWEE